MTVHTIPPKTGDMKSWDRDVSTSRLAGPPETCALAMAPSLVSARSLGQAHIRFPCRGRRIEVVPERGHAAPPSTRRAVHEKCRPPTLPGRKVALV